MGIDTFDVVNKPTNTPWYERYFKRCWNYIINKIRSNTWKANLLILTVIISIILILKYRKNDKRYKFMGLPEGYEAPTIYRESKSSGNKTEDICRIIFQDIYQTAFDSVRPDFLKNPETKRNLELDGYNPDIKTNFGKGIAFEYDGKQHMEYVPRFHSSVEDFQNQIKRDRFKTEMCKQQGIVLVRIPHYIPKEKLLRYIQDRLKEFEALPHQIEKLNIDPTEAVISNIQQSVMF